MNKNNEKILCCICNKKRVEFYRGVCQLCYRNKILNRYTYRRIKYKYRNMNNIKNNTYREVVAMACFNKYNRKEIAKKFNISERMVTYIVEKYCYKCDKYGNIRPEKFNN